MPPLQGRRLELWPEADRLAWLAANTASDDPWDTDGAALTLRPATRTGYARAYGIWLAWLDATDQLKSEETPGQRVTPERVTAWVRHMRGHQRKDGTIKLYLFSLHAMIGLIAPGTDTSFMLRPGGRSLHALFPSTAKPATEQDAANLIPHAIHLHEKAMAYEPGHRRSIFLRDAALMAVLYSRGSRISDLAAVRIGEHYLPQADGGILIRLTPDITKIHRLIEYPLDPWCVRIVADYVAHGRPCLPGAEATDNIWIGATGRPLHTVGLTAVVRRRNREFLGVEAGPHMVRKWLTDTARRRSPEAALDAAEVLGHSPQTALKHYAQAQDAHAGRRHGENLTRLRRKTAGLAERAFAERARKGEAA